MCLRLLSGFDLGREGLGSAAVGVQVPEPSAASSAVCVMSL